MVDLLLVAATPDEEATLAEAFGADFRSVPLTELRSALDDAVNTVVLGAATDNVLAAVQWAHRAQPVCGVVVLTTAENDAELRRSAMYAPGMPSTLTLIGSADERMPEQVREVLEASRLQRAHQETLTAVTARETVSTPHALAPASLGALLDHAPFGVLVGDLEARLVTWNRWAGDLLELPNEAAGSHLPALFPAPDYLEAAFVLARSGRLDEVAATTTVEGPGETAVELSAAPTRLDNGDEAVLVLVQDVTGRHQAELTRDRLAEQVGLLGRVSEALAGTLDVDTALGRLADQLIPSIADWTSLQTHDERGQSRKIVVRHRDRALDRDSAAVRDGLVAGLGANAPSRTAVRLGQPVLLPTVSSEELASFVDDEPIRQAVARLGLGSVISVPMPGRDGVRGSMTLVRRPGSATYTPQELAVAVEIGRRVGVTLDTLALHAQQRDIAAGLQRSLLTDPPENEQTEIAVRYVAATQEAQVGGDWYDAFVQADGSTVLVIGDVMGHDTRAAAAMGQLRALLRGISYTTGCGPAEMLSRLDAAIEGLDIRTTATGLVVQVSPRGPGDPGPAHLCWSNAGHPPAILVSPGRGAVALENDEADLLLGVLAHTERQERPEKLVPGATLLLYTDGLVERRGESIDEGVGALVRTVDRLSHLPLEAMCDRVLAEMIPAEYDDDVALVAVRLRSPVVPGSASAPVTQW